MPLRAPNKKRCEINCQWEEQGKGKVAKSEKYTTGNKENKLEHGHSYRSA